MMAVQYHHNLLRRVVRIAHASDRSHIARFRTLAVYLAKTLHLASTTFYILDKEHRYLERCISSSGPPKAVACMIAIGQGVAGRCADLKAEVREKTPSLHPEEARSGNEEEFLALPLMAGSRLWGVVSFGLHQGASISVEASQALPDIFTLAVGIIHGLRLTTESERRVRNLTALSDLGWRLNRAIPPRDLVPLILNSCHSYSASCCTILRMLKDNDLPAGVFKKCRSGLRPYLKNLMEIEVDCSTRMLTIGMPFLACDLVAEQELPPSYVCLPLNFEGKTIGTLTFFGKKEKRRSRNYDEEDREFFDSMALLVANTLACAASYRQVLRFGDNNEKKIKELSLLYRVSNTMLSTIRLNKLIHLILTALTSREGPFFDRAMLFLINERAGVMQGILGVTRQTSAGLIAPLKDEGDILDSRWDISEKDMIRQRSSKFSKKVMETRLELNKSHSVLSEAVLGKRLIHLPDATREEHGDRDFIRRFGISSFAASPLIAKGKVVGVLIVDNFVRGRPLTQDGLHFLQLFTNQASMAIENSMLYNRIEDVNRNLREARENLVHGEHLAVIGEMAADIAHELKGPMVSIGGFARRLEKMLPPASAERDYAETILREVVRLEKMLSDTLTFSRKATICYTTCAINELIDDSLAIVEPSLEESGISVIKRFPPKKFSFLCDYQQLKQVFINLFFNAHEAMKSGGTLKISVMAATVKGADAISVNIADSGGGITPEVLCNMFNPFYTTKETGTGLGLTIANRIVTNHGGKIQVNNRPGIGAEFVVLLPLHP
ncbi:MAG: GAF domain-containing protein [Geobacteraceae bacterium]